MVGRAWGWWITLPPMPFLTFLVSLQGNNIMLVASQPEPQGPERRSYEIIFREVGSTWLCLPGLPSVEGMLGYKFSRPDPDLPLTLVVPPTHRSSGSGQMGSLPPGSTCSWLWLI